MTTARDEIRNTIATTLKLDEQGLADEIVAALLSAPDLEPHLELAAKLNPWRPGPAPRDDDIPVHGIEITADGHWWRHLLPPAPPSEDKAK